MPIEVVKYTCQFKCFKRAVSDRSSMERHEVTCWKNPANETCKTCKNETAYTERDGVNVYPVRECKIRQLNEVFEKLYDKLAHELSLQIKPIYHCKYYNKDDDGNSQDFTEELLKEYGTNNAGTYHFPYHQPIAEGKFDVFGNEINKNESYLS